jgi:predicted O-methyltransferase YrrM
MPHPATLARKVYHIGQRLAHPVVDSFLPVTYTREECRRRIQALDPRGSRSNPESNPDTDERMIRLATALGVEKATAPEYLDQARRVRLAEVEPSDGPDLASPMCHEDRYATYLVTRIAAPRLAIETGIAHGISSAHILAAMQAGDVGRLISIEIDSDPRIGQYVPESLRHRWTRCTGSSLEVLPQLLESHHPIDLFLHDSDHNYHHVWRELNIVWPYLRSGGIVCAHDILHSNAFPRFVQKHESEIDAWVGSVNFGLIRKQE